MKKKKSNFLFYSIVVILLSFLIFNRQIMDKITEYNERNLPDSFTEYLPMSTFYYDKMTDIQKQTYICIFNGIKECNKKISIPKITDDDLSIVFEGVEFDNPDIFYVGDKGYIISVAGAYYFEPEYLMDNFEISKYRKQLDDIVSFVKEKTNGLDKFNTELFIHDYISENCTYYQSDFDNTVYGCLINKQAVCSGYSAAFMYLMNKCGLDCNVIAGDAVNKNNISNSHMWNLVEINNEYYFTDVTWDDINSETNDNCIHLYFNMSYNDIKKNHTSELDLSGLYYGSEYNYFTKNEIFFSIYNRSIIDGLINRCIDNLNSDIYSVEFAFNGKASYNTACESLFNNNKNNDLSYLIYHINLKANKTVNFNSVSYIKNDTFNYIIINFSEKTE